MHAYGHRIQNGIFGLEVHIEFKMRYLDPGLFGTWVPSEPGTQEPGNAGPRDPGTQTWGLDPGIRTRGLVHPGIDLAGDLDLGTRIRGARPGLQTREPTTQGPRTQDSGTHRPACPSKTM